MQNQQRNGWNREGNELLENVSDFLLQYDRFQVILVFLPVSLLYHSLLIPMLQPARCAKPGSRSPSRRKFLQSTAAMSALSLLDHPVHAENKKRLKVAAIFTEMTYRSHAHVLLENFLEPYYFNGHVTDPGCDIVSFFCDQFPEKRDMAREIAKSYKIPLFATIGDALTLGGRELAVDAVLSIGEHGNYPINAKGQREYPRKRFFDQIVNVFRRSGRAVPVFNDKHLSYRWDWAQQMYDTSRELKIPLF